MASLATPTVSRSGKLIEYSTSALPALGHGAPSPSEYIKNFFEPPNPPRRLKRKTRTSRATKKKAKIVVEAVPMEATPVDLDIAIDAATNEQSNDDMTRQTDTQAPLADVAAYSSPKTGAKFKVITYRPYLRTPKPPTTSSTSTLPADAAPEPGTATVGTTVRTTTSARPADISVTASAHPTYTPTSPRIVCFFRY
uniref:Uncharacterized protein n=1 Tax=Oryza brachyantha TaxID=4533 RepID=J3N8N2_ORYBR